MTKVTIIAVKTATFIDYHRHEVSNSSLMQVDKCILVEEKFTPQINNRFLKTPQNSWERGTYRCLYAE